MRGDGQKSEDVWNQILKSKLDIKGDDSRETPGLIVWSCDRKEIFLHALVFAGKWESGKT